MLMGWGLGENARENVHGGGDGDSPKNSPPHFTGGFVTLVVGATFDGG